MLRIIRRARDAANRDFLTGLYNRRRFFEKAEPLYRRAAKGELQIVVAMIDADHFKNINDTFGHQVGDDALVEIAATLRDQVGSSGLVARYGGEEFVCLHVLDGTVDPLECLDQIRLGIAAIELYSDVRRVAVTASIGATQALHGNLDQMLAAADRAVYAAKKAGRNRVEIG